MYLLITSNLKLTSREKKGLAKTTQNIMGFRNLKFVSLNSHYYVENKVYLLVFTARLFVPCLLLYDYFL